jgi:hypothetical protein
MWEVGLVMNEKDRFYARMASIIASYYYGSIPSFKKLSSHDGYVFRLRFDAGKRKGFPYVKDKVIKIGKPEKEMDARREQKVLLSLYDLGFEVPKLEYTQKDRQFNNLIYSLMPFIPTRPLESIYEENPEKGQRTIMRIGHFIRRLAALNPDRVDGALNSLQGREKEIKTWVRAYNILKEHGFTDPLIMDIMYESRKLHERLYGTFVHRDGPQVVTDGGRHFAVIDWTSAGAGHPLRSLGIKIGENLIWLKEPLRSQEWESWIIKGYLGENRLIEKMKKELRILTAYYMLLIVRSNLSVGNRAEAERIVSIVKDKFNPHSP